MVIDAVSAVPRESLVGHHRFFPARGRLRPCTRPCGRLARNACHRDPAALELWRVQACRAQLRGRRLTGAAIKAIDVDHVTKEFNLGGPASFWTLLREKGA